MEKKQSFLGLALVVAVVLSVGGLVAYGMGVFDGDDATTGNPTMKYANGAAETGNPAMRFAQGELPDGHPPLQKMPEGHPPIDQAAKEKLRKLMALKEGAPAGVCPTTGSEVKEDGTVVAKTAEAHGDGCCPAPEKTESCEDCPSGGCEDPASCDHKEDCAGDCEKKPAN